MTTKIEEVTLYNKIYIAKDGQKFTTEYECLFYEWRLDAEVVWIVYERGQRTNNVELYSTERLAKESIKNHLNFMIKKIYINERLFIKNQIKDK